MKQFLLLFICGVCCVGSLKAEDQPTVIVVVGADGAEEFGEQFHSWAKRWFDASRQAKAKLVAIGLEATEKVDDRDRLKQALADEAAGEAPLWIVFIGHGTFDGKSSKFNARGPDFSSTELAAWLKPIRRPVAVIDCASCSGPFLTELSAPNRVVITSTRSGYEINFARFGDHLSAAIISPEADLDKDDQTSLLEAFLLASSRMREFFATEARLATEHSLIDDNGDKLGTPADWFVGLRAVKTASDGASLDGTFARQFVLLRGDQEEQFSPDARGHRDSLERQLSELREKKSSMSEAEYFARLEPILVAIARIYQQP